MSEGSFSGTLIAEDKELNSKLVFHRIELIKLKGIRSVFLFPSSIYATEKVKRSKIHELSRKNESLIV